MQQNRIPLLGGLLVVLLGIAYFAGVFESEPTTIRVPDVNIPAEEVTRIHLTGGEFEASLSRETGTWRLESPVMGPADTTVVSRLVTDLGNLELGSIVSTNPERYSQYGVDSTSSALTLEWNGASTDLVVSSTGPDFSSNYVRLGDDRNVYVSRTRIGMPTDLDRLRDKTLVSVDPVEVVSATVRTPDYAYDLTYGASGWMIAAEGGAGVAADSTRIATWLRRFNPLRMDGFMDDLTPDSVAATHSVRLVSITGTAYDIRMEERGSDLAVVTDNGSSVLKAFASRLSTLVEDPDELTAQ